MPKNAITITGIKQLGRTLNDVKVKLANEANRVMKTQEAPAVLRRAKSLVPVKTGRLRDSGKVESTKGASGTSVDIVFDTPYALKVHETHPTHSQFLIRAVRERSRGLTGRLAAKLSQALRKIVK